MQKTIQIKAVDFDGAGITIYATLGHQYIDMTKGDQDAKCIKLENGLMDVLRDMGCDYRYIKLIDEVGDKGTVKGIITNGTTAKS